MTAPSLHRFGLIGSGRVATHLGRACVSAGLHCTALWSPTAEHATALARELGTTAAPSLSALPLEGLDFLLISIKDDAISEVVQSLAPRLSCPLLHTAGSVPLRVLTDHYARGGVLYPMQTFSKERAVDLTQVPFFIEASDRPTMQLLEQLCQLLGVREVHALSSEQRQVLHLASVFACNFVNHLYAQSAHLLEGIGLPFTIMEPLVRETLEKALSTSDPNSLQTGPAVRGDQRVMALQRHKLEELGAEEAATLYDALSRSIQEMNSKPIPSEEAIAPQKEQ